MRKRIRTASENADINGAEIVGKSFLRGLGYAVSIVLTIVIIGLITAIIVGSTFALYVDKYVDVNLDDFEYLSTNQDLTTQIFYYDENGEAVEIEEARLFRSQNRMWVEYEKIPKNLINAYVSIEDHRFWEHNGVDFITTVKSAFKYFTGSSMAGGSTITQQLIKNVTQEDDVTVQRKIQEIKRALALEEMYDKTEILELYMNIIYLSEGCYGVESAAQTYFGKDVSELSLVECAAIAAITQNPYKWDPFIFPENNEKRRNDILYMMNQYGYISDEEFDAAVNQELVLYYGDDSEEQTKTATNSWYTDAVIEEAIDLLMEHFGYTYETASNALFTGGFKIYTAMDKRVQDTLEEVFEDDSLWAKADDSAIQPESAMVIMEPYTGKVLGLVGGRGEKTLSRAYNLATMAKRPPGSSLKPLSVYAPAMDRGLINWATPIDDTPFNFGTEKINEDGSITYSRLDGWPNNYPAGYKGLTPLWDAVRRSVNTCSLKVLQKLTLNESYEFLTSVLNFDTIVDYDDSKQSVGVISDINWAPLGLGQLSYGVTVKDMTAAYCMFANGGIYTDARIVLQIYDSNDKLIIDNDINSEIAISEETAAIMTKILQNVVSTGTASAIKLKNQIECAGKTGTTSDDYDRYFVGYTPYYVGGIWFGYEIGKTLSKFSTSPGVLIWDEVMTRLHQNILDECAENGTEPETFEVPATVVKAEYCRDSGKLATDACMADPRGSRVEEGWFAIDDVPTEPCDCHVLVAYDSVCGGVACAECPEENITWVGLIREETRKFPSEIFVNDAQYVYRDIGDQLPSGDPYKAFFAKTLSTGFYPGTTGSGMPFNKTCPVHYNSNTSKGLYGVGEDDGNSDNNTDE